VPLVNLLYDHRYHEAGPILALMRFSVTAQIATSNYDGAHLSHGNSRWQFAITSLQALTQVGLSFLLISHFGLVGAIFGIGLTFLVTYPLRAYIARRYQAWDPKTDLMAFALGMGFFAVACALWRAPILALMEGR